MGDDYIIAPHRIIDEELQRVVYGTGQKVPMADAIKYGLVDGKAAKRVAAKKATKAPARGKRGPVEDRARKPSEDRGKPAKKAAKKAK